MSDAGEMQRPRRVLKLRGEQDPAVRRELLRRAIETRTFVTATYNRGALKLAPHVLYERDDALFVDAVTVERDGQPPREAKLGAFRIAGLTNLRATTETFDAELDVPLEEPRYSAGILARV